MYKIKNTRLISESRISIYTKYFIVPKEVKNWRHFSFDDPFQHIYEDETELEHRISELYETMYRELYEFYRDELSEQLLPRCTCGANTYCRCE